MRATLTDAPSVEVTVDPAVPATAARVNTHDLMSGLPSSAVPRNVHPAGVVAVVAELAVMIRIS